MMSILGIIPSRYGSSRLPGKPLIDINGKSMIQRVYEQSLKARSLDTVIVATDDKRIFEHVRAFGGQVVMTSPDHKNGTERCGEVLKNISRDYDVIFNIQGDEPFIKPGQIDQLADCFKPNTLVNGSGEPPVQIATLVKKIKSHRELNDPAIMKVLLNKQKEAIYFSRTAVPYLRDVEPRNWLKNHTFYKHICFYGFETKVLKKLIKLKSTPLEKAESLEQLRWIENGYRIKVGITTLDTQSIDTPEDLERLVKS